MEDWERAYNEWRSDGIPNDRRDFDPRDIFRAGFIHGSERIVHVGSNVNEPNFLTPEEITLLKERKVISCIKSIRDRLACRLITAKKFLDDYRRIHGV